MELVWDWTSLDLSINASRYFTPNSPIDKQTLFHGRRDQLLRMVDAVNQRGQQVVLYGERGVGKTSLASVFSESLGGAQVVCPRIHCESTDTFGSVWRRMFARIRVDRSRHVMGFGDSIGTSRTTAAESLQGDPTPSDVLGLLEQLTVDPMRILILVFDECDRLPPRETSAFAETVKMLSDYAVRATVVLVGVADSVDQLISAHESVERALAQVRLPRMSGEETARIITAGLKHLHLGIEPDAEKRIVLLSQGLPHYTHLLGLYSVRAATLRQDSGCVTVRDVDQAIQMALQDAQQSIRSAFHRATSSPRRDNLFQHVLCACATAKIDDLGYFAAADVRDPMLQITGRAYGISAFARHLSDFCGERRGRILQRVGTPRRYRYRFRNPLLQPFTIMKGLDSGLIGPGTW